MNFLDIFLSGFIDANDTLIKNYPEFRDKYSAKRTRGLANAVAKCDEFLADPIVSFGKHIFSFLFSYKFLSVHSRNLVIIL